MYKNETDFCILVLYSATLLNSYINSHSVSVESLEFSMYMIMSSAIEAVLLPSNLDAFFFFLLNCSGYDFKYYAEQDW